MNGKLNLMPGLTTSEKEYVMQHTTGEAKRKYPVIFSRNLQMDVQVLADHKDHILNS